MEVEEGVHAASSAAAPQVSPREEDSHPHHPLLHLALRSGAIPLKTYAIGLVSSSAPPETSPPRRRAKRNAYGFVKGGLLDACGASNERTFFSSPLTIHNPELVERRVLRQRFLKRHAVRDYHVPHKAAYGGALAGATPSVSSSTRANSSGELINVEAGGSFFAFPTGQSNPEAGDSKQPSRKSEKRSSKSKDASGNEDSALGSSNPKRVKTSSSRLSKKDASKPPETTSNPAHPIESLASEKAGAASTSPRDAKHAEVNEAAAAQEQEEEEDETTKLYCVCKTPWDDDSDVMLSCDGPCEGWYHVSCLGAKTLLKSSPTTNVAKDTLIFPDGARIDVTKFLCPACELETTQLLERDVRLSALRLATLCDVVDDADDGVPVDADDSEEPEREEVVVRSSSDEASAGLIPKPRVSTVAIPRLMRARWTVLMEARDKRAETAPLSACAQCAHRHHPLLPCAAAAAETATVVTEDSVHDALQHPKLSSKESEAAATRHAKKRNTLLVVISGKYQGRHGRVVTLEESAASKAEARPEEDAEEDEEEEISSNKRRVEFLDSSDHTSRLALLDTRVIELTPATRDPPKLTLSRSASTSSSATLLSAASAEERRAGSPEEFSGVESHAEEGYHDAYLSLEDDEAAPKVFLGRFESQLRAARVADLAKRLQFGSKECASCVRGRSRLNFLPVAFHDATQPPINKKGDLPLLKQPEASWVHKACDVGPPPHKSFGGGIVHRDPVEISEWCDAMLEERDDDEEGNPWAREKLARLARALRHHVEKRGVKLCQALYQGAEMVGELSPVRDFDHCRTLKGIIRFRGRLGLSLPSKENPAVAATPAQKKKRGPRNNNGSSSKAGDTSLEE